MDTSLPNLTGQIQSAGTVAFLDILGFRNKIESKELGELARKYEYILSVLPNMSARIADNSMFPNHPVGERFCNFYVFSDSIILLANEESMDGVTKLLMSTWRISQAMLAAGFPLRGGIASGELYVNESARIFLGKALTRAFELEKQQDWIGISIDDSVCHHYPDLQPTDDKPPQILDIMFPFFNVPLKDKSTKKMRTINWRFNLVVEEGTRSLFGQSSDPLIQKKIEHSLAYAKHIVDSGYVYLTDKASATAPAEVQAFWIGDAEPPYDHGDEL